MEGQDQEIVTEEGGQADRTPERGTGREVVLHPEEAKERDSVDQERDSHTERNRRREERKDQLIRKECAHRTPETRDSMERHTLERDQEEKDSHEI
jgi:hypothetical protein